MKKKPGIVELRLYLKNLLPEEEARRIELLLQSDEELKSLLNSIAAEEKETEPEKEHSISGGESKELFAKLQESVSQPEPQAKMIFRLSDSSITVLLLSGKRVYLGNEYVKVLPITPYTEFAGKRDIVFSLPGIFKEEYTTHIHLVTIVPVDSLEQYVGKITDELLEPVEEAVEYRNMNLLYSREVVEQIDESIRHDFIKWTSSMQLELQKHRNRLDEPPGGTVTKVKERSKVIYTLTPGSRDNDTIEEPEIAYSAFRQIAELITDKEKSVSDEYSAPLAESDEIRAILTGAGDSASLKFFMKKATTASELNIKISDGEKVLVDTTDIPLQNGRAEIPLTDETIKAIATSKNLKIEITIAEV